MPERYDVFCSYSTDPDYKLVRHVQTFLERFHQTRTSDDITLRPLRVCVDESALSRQARRTEPEPDSSDPIWDAIRPVLASSKNLLVFCSRGSRDSKWVQGEIEWWLEHRSAETLLLAVTEGTDPAADPESVFPAIIVAEQLHARLWFDLRGWYGSAAKQWIKVRDFEQATVNIAAQLNGESPDAVLPLWYREQRRRLNRRNLVTSAVALVMLLLAGVIFVFQQSAAMRARINEAARYSAEADAVASRAPQRSLLLAAVAPTFLRPGDTRVPAVEQALRDASARLSGTGFAGHEQGVLCAHVSADNRFLITGSDDGTARLYDLQAESPRESVRVLKTGHRWVATASFAPGGRWLATADGFRTGFLRSDLHSCALWDLRNLNPSKPQHRLHTHSDEVSVVSFSPDGNWFATGSGDNSIHLHRLTDGGPEVEPISVDFHAEEIVEIRFSPDSRTFVSAARDGTAALWKIGETEEVQFVSAIPKTSDGYVAIDITTELDRVATAASDGVVRVWRFANEQVVEQPELQLRTGPEPCFVVRFSPNGRWLIAAPGFVSQFGLFQTMSAQGLQDYRVTHIWDLGAANPAVPLKTLAGGSDTTYVCAFSPDSERLATAGPSGTVNLWDLSDEGISAAPRSLPGFDSQVAFVEISDEILAAGGADGTARVWDIRHLDAPSWPRRLIGHTKRNIRHLALSQSQRWLVTGADDGNVALWDLHSGDARKPHSVISPDSGRITGLAFARNDQQLIASGRGGTARIWKLSKDGLAEEDSVSVADASELAVTRDGSRIAIGGFDGSVFVWSPESDDPRTQLKCLCEPRAEGKEDPQPVSFVKFNDGGRSLAVGRNGGQVAVWNTLALNSGDAMNLSGHSGTILSLAFSRNGRWLVSASGDDTARVWDLRASDGAHAYATLEGHSENVTAAAFSACGKWIYTASVDSTIRQWDLTCPRDRIDFVDLRGHQDWVTDLVVSADGLLLASGGNDGTTRLWQLDPIHGWDGQPPIVLTPHQEPRTVTVVGPRWIATAAHDGVTQLHPRSPSTLLNSVPVIVGRRFSDMELAEYFTDQPPKIADEQERKSTAVE